MVTKIFIKTSGLKGFTSLLIACCFAFGFGMHEVNAATDCNDYAQSVEHSPGNLDNPSNALGAPDAQGAYFYEGSSGPYTRLVVDMGQTISAGQQICFLAKSSTGSSDLSTWSLTSGAPSSGSYALIQSLHINTTGYTEFCVTLTEDCRYFKITDDGAGPFYVDAIYYSATADWDLVELGSNESCIDACDGSILIDPNFNVTGDFTVSYDYDGQTITSGVMTGPEGRYLTGLCPGLYSNFTITGVNTGCSDIWSHDVVVGAGTADCVETPGDWFYECGEDVIVEKFGYNAKCRKTVAINIDNPSNVFQAVVEIVWKSNNPGASLVIEDQDGTTYTLFREQPAGGSPNVWIYRGVIPGNVSYVFYDVPDHIDCSLQSVVVQVFRNVVDAPANSGVFTNISGYNDIQNFSIAIPTNDVDRDLTIELPISELTPDGRYMKITVTSGTVTETLYIYGPDATLPGGDCCLAIPSLTLANVPGTASSVDIEIDTRNGQNGQGVNGQSWVISGSVVVELECTECITDGGIIEGDQSFCAPYDPDPISNVVPASGTGCPDILVEEEGCEDGDKPSRFIFKYTGNDCSIIASNPGNPDIECTGDPASDPLVYIVINDSENDLGGSVYFAGLVQLGDVFEAAASNAGETKFASSTYIHILDMQGGTELQLVRTHMSCSDPIRTGDYYGGLQLLLAEFENGFIAGEFQQGPSYFWQQKTTGAWETISGASGESYDPGFITENVMYRRISTGCCADDTSNVVIKEIDPVDIDGGLITGDEEFCEAYDASIIENVAEVSSDECPEILTVESCCEDGDDATSLTLKYTGEDCMASSNNQGSQGGKWDCSGDPDFDGQVYIIVNDDENGLGGDIYFSDVVNINSSFTATAALAGATKFSSNTYIHILDSEGGSEIQTVQLHTSCSVPIVTGDQFGSIILVSADFDNGFQCGSEQPQSSYEWISRPLGGNWTIIPDATGASYDPGLITETTEFIRIGTNCCGSDSSNIVTKYLTTSSGGSISGDDSNCGPFNFSEITSVEPASAQCAEIIVEEECCADGSDFKPASITVQYTGQDCSATSTNQPSDKWNCSGDPAGDPMVYIIVNNKNDDPFDGDIWFSGSVALGSTYVIDAANAGQDKLSSNTAIHIFDTQGGNIIQTVNFHTSCSKPLNAGDVYGANAILSLTGEAGDQCGEVIIPDPSISYQWQIMSGVGAWADISGATGESYDDPATISLTTKYRRISTTCCGIDTSNMVIHEVLPLPTVNAGPDVETCGQQTTTITAVGSGGTPGYSYFWDNGLGAGASHDVSPEVTTTYTVEVTDSKGCTATDAVTITVLPTPNVNAGPDVETCGQQTTTLTAVGSGGTPGYTYFWDNGLGAGASHDVSPEVTTTYTVEVTDSKGCTAQDAVTITVLPTPNVNAGPDVETCGQQTTTLTAVGSGGTPGYTYFWDNGLGAGASHDVSPEVTTTYTVEVTDSKGCTATDAVTITVLPTPNVNAGRNVETCGQQTTTLIAIGSGGTPGYTYFWDNGLGAGATHDVSPEVTTTYTVEVTDSKGCTATDAVTITVLPTPNVNAGPDVETCGQQTTTLTAVGSGGTPGYTYFWDNGLGAGASHDVSPEVTTTYTVEVTDSKGCTAQDAVTITVLPTPNVNAGPDVETCGQQTTTLTAVGSGGTPGYTYFWDNGLGAGASHDVSPEVTTTYTVEVTDSKGCTAQDAVTITVLPTPNVNAGPDVETCGQQTTTLTAVGSGGTPGYTYFWDNGLGAGASHDVSPEVTTTYTVEVTDSKGCTAQDAVTITVLPTPNVNAGPDVETCGQQTTTLTAVGSGGTPGYTYFWDNGLGAGAVQTVSPEVTTTYTVEITDSKGCTAQDAVTITVLPTPNVNAGPDVETCGQQTTTLTAVGSGGTPGYTYFWDNGLGAGAVQTVSPEVTTTYTVEITDSKGCTAQDAVTITVLPTPNVNAGPDVETCGQQTTTLTAVGSGGTPGYTYFWDNGLGAGAVQTVSPEVTTTYTVEVTDSKGCTAQDAVTITVLPTPNVNAGPDVETCGQQTTTLTAVGSGGTPGYTYFWDNGLGAGASHDVSPEVTTTYTVEVTDSKGCTAQDAVTITVLPTPNVNAGPDVETCGQQTTTLTAVGSGGTPGYTYFWDNGLGAGASHDVSPEVTTTYTVEVTDSKGCTAQDAVTITVLPTPNVNAGPDVETCGQQTTTLTAVGSGGTPGYTYFWDNGLGAGASQTVSPEVTTTYTVEVTDSKGCTAQDAVTITVLPTPNVNAGPDVETCGQQTTTLTAVGSGGTPGYTYFWDNGLGAGASQTVSPEVTTTYTVEVTDSKGCTAQDAVTITVLPTPNVNAGPDVETCGQQTTTITAVGSGGTPGYTYFWDNGLGAGASHDVSPEVTTTYTVEVTDSKGCTAQDAVTITVLPTPNVNAGPDVETCGQQTTTITAVGSGGTPGYSYFWDNGLGAGASHDVSPEVTTTYTVEVTDSKGCTAQDQVTITVLPTPNVNAGPDVETCGQQTTTITAVGSGGTPGYTYFWDNGLGAGASHDVSPEVTTTYTVEVTDSKGCTAQDAVTITVLPTPNVNAGPDVETCGQQTTTITAVGSGGTPGYTYFWDNGLGAGASHDVSPEVTTTYTVEVTDSKGCTAQDQVTITVLPTPNVNAGPDVETCGQQTTTITAVGSGGTPGYTYFWDNGLGAGASHDVSPEVTTTYTVEVTDSKGCTAQDAVTITVLPTPNVNAGPDVETCGQQTTTITAVGSGGTPGYTYFWDNGLGAGASHDVSPEVTTTYTVEVTDSKGCTAQDQVTITVLPTPNVNAGPDVETCGQQTTVLTAVGSGGTPGYTYFWNNSLGAGAVQTVNPEITTTYTVEVTDSKGCTAQDQVTITVLDEPNVTVNKTDATCGFNNGTATAVATGGNPPYGYSWSNGANTAAITGLATGTYTVTVTDNKGCIARETITISDLGGPTASAQGDEICAGETATISGSFTGGTQPVTIAWSNGETTATIQVSPAQTTTYTFTATDANGCESSATATVTVNPNPVVNAGDDVETCGQQTTTLTATTTGGTPGFTYFWDNGLGAGATHDVSPEVTTTYTVEVTDSKGCTDQDQVTITVLPTPNVNAGPDVETCGQQTTTITAVGSGGTPGYTYFWDNGLGAGATHDVSPEVTTTYTVEATDSKGCTAQDQVTITVLPTPNVNAGPDVETCGQQTTTITAVGSGGTPGYTYFWDNGLGAGASHDVSPEITTTYTVEVTDSKGCTAQDQVTIIVLPEPNVSVNSPEICEGESATLTASASGGTAPFSYEWSTGATTASITVSPAATTTYSVTVTDAKGCLANGNGTVTVNPNPTVDAGDDVETCGQGQTTLTAVGSGGTPGYTYFWNMGLGAGATHVVSPEVTTTYTVEITDSKGCTSQDQVTVIVLDEPNVDAGPDLIICLGESAELSASANGGTPGYTFNWNQGLGAGATQTVTPTQTTVYTVTVTDSKGCIGTDQVRVVVSDDACTSLGDFVWEDLNANGIQDPNEPGVENVTVYLKDANGVIIDTTQTAADGSYLFGGLPAGTYSVQFELPVDFNFSPANQGGNDAEDSDADPNMNGMTQQVTLNDGDNNPTLDAGIYQDAALGNFVFEDLDGDGVQDPGEGGIPNVTVYLKDENGVIIDTTETDGNGNYEFTGLTPGEYSVQFILPAGYDYTTPNQGGNEATDSDADPTMNGMTDPVTLTSGETNNDLDAGLIQPASIGDFVWEDDDADGVQDPGEDGIEGVTVYLLDDNGNYLDTTTTANDGSYEFTGLTPGDYIVEFETPNGFDSSPADQGGNDATDSDANPSNGQTGVINLESGENDDTNDAGFYQPASIGDFVFEDTDADGVQDPGEDGIEGVTVYLLDDNGNYLDTTTTDATGFYEFTGLTPGDYVVEFVAPAGYTGSPADQGGNDAEDSDANPISGTTDVINLESGEDDTTIDAGFYESTSLGDFVWEDDNADGVQDPGEDGIEGVTVYLLDDNGNYLDTTSTGPNGEYQFTDLEPGDYIVEFETPSGFESSPANQGGNDATDSDANPANGQTGVINLESGENDPTNDAGFYQLAALGDFVFEDLDGDGVQDPGEGGIEGVTVYLKDENGVIIDTTETDGNGNYEFTGLTPGEYSVQFILPAGYDYTTPNQGGNEATDSDADPTMNGMTDPVTLTSGETNNDLDAGLIQPASIGDFVWEDDDADGVQDPGEDGIEGVTVYLLDDNGNYLDTTTTANDGSYEFTGLTPGDYIVEFETPNGFDSSPADQGGNDATDSDANPSNGQTGVINLESGENDDTNDAGFYQPASIGDFVFEDTDADGVQDPGEDGVEGVTVYLLDNNGNYLDTTTTNANGFYEFTDLEPGTYVVEFELPAGFSFSPANQGGNDAADSDANPVNGQTGPITVTSGQNDDTNDAGLVTTCSVSASADPSPICAGASSTLTATPSGGLAPYSYEWSTGGTSQSITVTPAATTTYSVTLTDAVGCTSTAEVTVTVNPNPIANAGPDVANCGQEETTLTATATGGTPGYTYFWNQGLGAGATHIVSPEITTTYIVEVTDANGCTDQDEVTVVVNPEPLIEAGATPATCGEANGTASAQGFGGMPPYAYSWSNGANTQTITGLTPGDYTVTVTDAKGCSAEQTVTVTNNGVIPPVPTGVQDVRACDDKPIPTLVVFVPNGFTADWYDAPAGGNLLAAGTTSYQPAAFGTYYVQTRDPINGCISERIAIVVTPVDCEDCPTPDCLELEIER